MKKQLKGQRVLVTGGAGFIGSHLIRRLTEMGCNVIAMLKPSSDLWRIQDILDQLEILKKDLNDLDINDLKSALSEVRIVYHLGAAGVEQSYQDINAVVQTNITGTLSLLRLAQSLKADRFIYTGSCFEYGSGTMLSEDMLPEPDSEYAASKTGAWILTHAFSRKYGLPVVSLRPFTVYGPFEGGYRLVPYTIMRALEGAEIELTGGEQTRDFVYIDDMIDAFIKAAISPKAVAGTFNICSGLEISVREMVSTIVELTGNAARPLFGARPYRDTELWTLSGNPAGAKEKLDWYARTCLRDGLSKTIQWFQKHGADYPEYETRKNS